MDYANNTIITNILMSNLLAIFFLSVIICRCIKKYREKRLLYEKTSTVIMKEIFTYPSVLILAVCAGHFYSDTFPIIKDISYLAGQNYEEASGEIIECDTNEIVAEVTYRDNITKKITIKGSYDLNGGEEIVVRYLPHANIRMEWYILDDKTGNRVYQGTAIDSMLLDKGTLAVCMAVGCFFAVGFAILLYSLKYEEEEEEKRKRHGKILKYAIYDSSAKYLTL